MTVATFGVREPLTEQLGGLAHSAWRGGCVAPEPHDADVYATVHAEDKRLF